MKGVGPLIEVIIFLGLACIWCGGVLTFWCAALTMDEIIRRWRPMKKLIHRFQRWQEWRKLCLYSKLKQVLILLGIVKDKWFESFVDWRE